VSKGTVDRGGVTIEGGLPFRFYNKWDPFPARMVTNLRYSYTTTVSAPITTGAFGTEIVLRLNSLYDPLFSGAGDYPYQFPSLQLLYGKYLVDEVDVDIEFYDPSTGIICGALIQPSANTTTLVGLSVDQAMVKPGCALRTLNVSGEEKVRFNQRINIAQLEGMTRAQWEAQTSVNGAIVTTSPANTPWLRIAISSGATGLAASAVVTVALTFKATLFERLQTAS
jgi:hypothetical protein